MCLRAEDGIGDTYLPEAATCSRNERLRRCLGRGPRKASSVDYIVMTIMYSPESPENTSAWFKSDFWKESPR